MAGKKQTEYSIAQYLRSLNQMGAKLGLERVTKLLDALYRPQDSFKAVIVGGTSGKGSTAAMIASILTEAGYRACRYTSPHLSSITERICVDGKEISEMDFAKMIIKVRKKIDEMAELDGGVFDHPTFFEVVTAAAFCYFREKKAGFAVLEVGLGGRLDATNTTRPDNTPVSVITNISLEHTQILGDTIEKIAYEKAGIIKNGGLVVTASQEQGALEVFEKACIERNARMLALGKGMAVKRISTGKDGQIFEADIAGKRYPRLRVPLLGRHQLENAACAIGAVHALRLRGARIGDGAVERGLKKVRWPGRMEVVQEKPLVVLDGAKDAEAMGRLREAIEEDVEYRRAILVIGISADKNIPLMVDVMAPLVDRAVITAHKVAGRAADMELIAREMRKQRVGCMQVPDVADAVKKALSLSGEGDLVLVTGSLFTVAEARELWHKSKARWGRELSETPKG